jgi:hypothetical protein
LVDPKPNLYYNLQHKQKEPTMKSRAPMAELAVLWSCLAGMFLLGMTVAGLFLAQAIFG